MPKTDLSTGLPEVPIGYKWKVKISWGGYFEVPSVCVTLKKGIHTVAVQVFLLGKLDPRDVEAKRESYDRHYNLVKFDPDTYPNVIYNVALEVLEKQAEQIERDKWNARYENATKNLNGAYPPKKLNKNGGEE